MSRLKEYTVALVVLATTLSSCLKKEIYPNEPQITYKSFNAQSIDKALLVFSFTDGDGDIGLKPNENLNVSGSDSIYYYNLYIKTYYKNYQGIFKDTAIYYTQTITLPNGTTSTITKLDTGLIRQRIQFVSNNNKDKSLKGEIYVDLNGYRQSVKHKVIKYKFYMYDRSRNKSNVVESPELVVP